MNLKILLGTPETNRIVHAESIFREVFNHNIKKFLENKNFADYHFKSFNIFTLLTEFFSYYLAVKIPLQYDRNLWLQERDKILKEFLIHFYDNNSPDNEIKDSCQKLLDFIEKLINSDGFYIKEII